MKEFKHYGKSVYKQVIDKDFRSVLRDNNIQYIDLPLLNVDVIKYEKDGITKYAVIRDLIVPEEFVEAVYITESIPDDCNWESLVEDVDAQEHGEEPALMSTKLKHILDMAENMAREKSDDDFMSLMSGGVSTEELGWALISMGYNKDKISTMDTSDVDKSLLNDLMEWLA